MKIIMRITWTYQLLFIFGIGLSLAIGKIKADSREVSSRSDEITAQMDPKT